MRITVIHPCNRVDLRNQGVDRGRPRTRSVTRSRARPSVVGIRSCRERGGHHALLTPATPVGTSSGSNSADAGIQIRNKYTFLVTIVIHRLMRDVTKSVKSRLGTFAEARDQWRFRGQKPPSIGARFGIQRVVAVLKNDWAYRRSAASTGSSDGAGARGGLPCELPPASVVARLLQFRKRQRAISGMIYCTVWSAEPIKTRKAP
jgi:hypothetical protein